MKRPASWTRLDKRIEKEILKICRTPQWPNDLIKIALQKIKIRGSAEDAEKRIRFRTQILIELECIIPTLEWKLATELKNARQYYKI